MPADFNGGGWLSEEEFIDLMQLLLDYSALEMSSALLTAIEIQNYELVERLLRSGANANVNTDDENDDFSDDQPYSMFPLERAVVDGRIEIVHLIIANGANETEIARALQAAVNIDQVEAAEVLIGYGANINTSPLSIVYSEDPHYMLPPRTALQAAAENRNIELVRLLLDSGAEVERLSTSPNEEGTALQFAAISGSIGVVSELIQRGATVDAPPMGERGRSALEGAAEHGRLDMVQLLLNLKADVRGSRAVQFARREGHDGVVTLLLENGLKDDDQMLA